MAISIKENAFVVNGAQTINLSSMFSVSASANNPTYLVLTGLDRNEYTTAATDTTGTLNGNGNHSSFTSVGDDARGIGIVFTYQVSTGRYYNSTYGFFDQMTYTASGSNNDVTNLSLFGTNNLSLANNNSNNAYAMEQLDTSGYLGSVTLATQPLFSTAIPAQATPDSIATIAQTFVGKVWNMNGCWVLASTIADEAGTSLPVDSSMIGVSAQSNGEWIVAFDGTKQSGNWQSLVKAGEIIVIGDGSSGHITTCVSGSGSTAMLIDNIAYLDNNGAVINLAHDGSSNDVTVSAAHLASQEWGGIVTSDVKIYELDTPIVTALVANDTVATSAKQQLASLFSVSDPANKTITKYQVYDTSSTDSFSVNGATQTAHTAASAVTVTSLSAISLIAGAATGSDTIEVRAFNGTYWGDWQTENVSITDASSSNAGNPLFSPTLTHATAGQTWTVGEHVSFTLASNTFTDPNGETLTYSASAGTTGTLPSWLTFEPSTLTFTGTVPTSTQSFNILVTASDTSGLTTSESVAITIPSATPTVTHQTVNQSWTVGQHVSFTLASNTFTDPNSLALTYSASAANGAPLPSWLTFQATTDTFSGTVPTNAQNLILDVTATDTNGLSISETFSAMIAAAAPTVTNPITNQTWTDGQKVSLVIPASTFTDPQGLHLNYSAFELSGPSIISWLSFNRTTDTFSGTVPGTLSGTAVLKVVATDPNGLSTSDTFNVTFNKGGISHATLVGVMQTTHGIEVFA